MTIDELNVYYKKLEKKFNSMNPDFELNEDRTHNTTIVRFMLDKSNKINMYCGEMSVFRKNFYDYINSQNVGLGDELKDKIIDSLNHFLSRDNTELNIYLENFDDEYFKDIVDAPIFQEGMETKKIKIYKLDSKMILKEGLSHVSYTDTNIVRMERNKKSHEAICAVNVPSAIMEKWIGTFKSMNSIAKLVEYPN